MFIPHPVESKLELGNTRRVHVIDATNVKSLAALRLEREDSIPKQELVDFEPAPSLFPHSSPSDRWLPPVRLGLLRDPNSTSATRQPTHRVWRSAPF